jgi:hypothetical protein
MERIAMTMIGAAKVDFALLLFKPPVGKMKVTQDRAPPLQGRHGKSR